MISSKRLIVSICAVSLLSGAVLPVFSADLTSKLQASAERMSKGVK